LDCNKGFVCLDVAWRSWWRWSRRADLGPHYRNSSLLLLLLLLLLLGSSPACHEHEPSGPLLTTPLINPPCEQSPTRDETPVHRGASPAKIGFPCWSRMHFISTASATTNRQLDSTQQKVMVGKRSIHHFFTRVSLWLLQLHTGGQMPS